MAKGREIIVLENTLPKGAKYQCEGDAEDLVDAHKATLADSAWTLEDDQEMETYAKCMDKICKKESPRNKTPSNNQLYLNLNEGPQYVTRAALLFLQTMYKDNPQLAAFQEAADEFGFAPPNKDGFHRQGKGGKVRAAPDGWPADEKITKHYSETVANARKPPVKKSPAKKSSAIDASSRTSTPGLAEEHNPSAGGHTAATFRPSPQDEEEEKTEEGYGTDKDVSMTDSCIEVATETKATDDEAEESSISPRKRARADDSTPSRFTAVNSRETPSPLKRRKMPDSAEPSPTKASLPDLSPTKTKPVLKPVSKAENKLPDLQGTSSKFSDMLPKQRTLPDISASKTKQTAELRTKNDNKRPESPNKSSKLLDISSKKADTLEAILSKTTNPDSKRLTELFAKKMPTNKDKDKAEGLPDLSLLDQMRAKKKDAHNAEMKKLTHEIDELTMREKKAAQELSDTNDRVAKMGEQIVMLVKKETEQGVSEVKGDVDEMHKQIETLSEELEAAKESQARLEAYVVQLVNQLAEAGSLTV